MYNDKRYKGTKRITTKGIKHTKHTIGKNLPIITTTVPVSKSRNIPEVVLVRRWAVGVLGIWRGGVGWVQGGANGVSLQAT